MTVRIRGASSIASSNDPLYVVDGVATLVFIGQNVGQGVTRDTLAVRVTRPDFDKLTLHVGEAEYTMDRVDPEGYRYSVTAEFPA